MAANTSPVAGTIARGMETVLLPERYIYINCSGMELAYIRPILIH